MPSRAAASDAVEPEIDVADLADSSADAHPSQSERWVGAGEEHEGQLRRAQIEQALDATVHIGVVDQVVVVEDDDESVSL